MRILATLIAATLLSGCLTKIPDKTGYEIARSGVTWTELDLGGYIPIVRRGAIAGADPATFRVLSETPNYAIDARRVYHRSVPLEGANPATFRLIGESHYATDGALVFYGGVRIQGADAATFEVHTVGHRASDARQFYEGSVVAGKPEDCGPPERVDATHSGRMLYFCYRLYGLS